MIFSIEAALQRCSENMQQIQWRTPIPKRDFTEVTLQLYCNHTWLGCSPLNLLHIFRTPFYKNTSGRLLLSLVYRSNFPAPLFHQAQRPMQDPVEHFMKDVFLQKQLKALKRSFRVRTVNFCATILCLSSNIMKLYF